MYNCIRMYVFSLCYYFNYHAAGDQHIQLECPSDSDDTYITLKCRAPSKTCSHDYILKWEIQDDQKTTTPMLIAYFMLNDQEENNLKIRMIDNVKFYGVLDIDKPLTSILTFKHSSVTKDVIISCSYHGKLKQEPVSQENYEKNCIIASQGSNITTTNPPSEPGNHDHCKNMN